MVKVMRIFVFFIALVVPASLAQPAAAPVTDVEIEQGRDEIVVVKVTASEKNEEQLVRQERRLDTSAADLNLPFTVEYIEGQELLDLPDNDAIEIEVTVEEEEKDDDDENEAAILVPQLWSNYTGPDEPPAHEVGCDVAQLKCAYRAGCGLALQNYMLGCSELAAGRTQKCNTHCRHSLIALMSTREGKRLMKVREARVIGC